VGENGSLQLNRSIKGLEGQLKIRVMAGDFNATLTALKRLESSFFDEPNLELTLVSTFLSFSPIATFLPKSAPGLHPFIATVSMLD
jgi:hypothetical protein